MQNTQEITFKLAYRAAAAEVEDKKEQVRIGKERVDSLILSLRALGCEAVAKPTKTGAAAQVKIKYPTVEDATRATKRGGRKSNGLPANSPLKGLSGYEAYRWIQEHKSAEGASAMGCSQSQYFRRKKKIEDPRNWDKPIEAILG